MSRHLGDFDASTVIYGKFTTYRPSSGAPFTLAGSPVLSVYKDNSTTESTTGVTLTVDFDSRTGMHHYAIDTSADGTFYAAGSFFDVVITTGTVDSVSAVGTIVGSFTIRKTSVLKPTVAGRTLDVSSGGEAGLDWANVGSPTTSLALTGTTIATTQKVDIETIKTQAVTAASGVTFPSSIASPTNITAGTITTVTTVTNQLTAAQIATGVWQDTTAGDFTVASSIGKSLYTSGVVPGAAGGLFIAGTNAATTITTGLTTTFTGNLTGSVGSVTGAVGSVTGSVGSVTGSVGSVTGLTTATIATAVWTDTTAGDFTTDTSPGKIIFTQLGGAFTTSSSSVYSTASLANAPTGGSAPTAAQVATAVWQDTTSGDFTVASSIGKSLFTSGAVPGAAGGLFIAGTNAATTVTTAFTTTFTGNLTGTVGSVTGNVGGNVVGSVASVTARVTANTDQLAGQTVTAAAGVTFPSSVASPTNITAGTITTVTTVTNQLTAAAIATGVWQDATAGDFTVASSIGKSLYIANVVPGAAGGHFIAGTNAATTVTTAFTTTFTGNLTGSVGSVTGAVGSVTARVTANADQLAGQTVTAAAGVTFPSSVASPTNITAATGIVLSGVTHTGAVIPLVTTTTTATNLTNAATAGDFTATMKTSIGTAVAASAVASVTGNVGGNVTGSVGSVVATVIKKNTALTNFEFMMTDSTNHAPVTGKTVTCTRSIDGSSFAAGTLANVAEVAFGIYRVDFSAADLNGNVITLRATASGSDDTFITINTNP